MRMNAHRLMRWRRPGALVSAYMSPPHFFALSLPGTGCGEIAFTGEGQAAKLIGLHVSPNYRRLGMAMPDRRRHENALALERA
ncbi:MAG: hypothetical protein ACLUE8_07295 [Lachnospiraceae bacterium]